MRSPTESRIHLDERIVNYIDGKRIDINSMHKDLSFKREFLHEVMGYTRLIGREGQSVPLDQCNDERVSAVAKKEYLAAKKRLQKNKEF